MMHTIINTSNKNAIANIIPMNHPAVATFSFGFIMMLSVCKNEKKKNIYIYIYIYEYYFLTEEKYLVSHIFIISTQKLYNSQPCQPCQ